MLFHSENTNTQNNKKRRVPSMFIPEHLIFLPHYKQKHCGRAALYTSGSLTIEAAVILPLFLFAALTMVSVMDLCRIQVVKQVELSEKAKKLSMYAYVSQEYLEEDYIDLCESESCKLAVSLIPNYTVDLALRGRVHMWTGRSESECAADAEKAAEELVYVTDHESVYHVSADCSHLKLSIYSMSGKQIESARNDYGGRYKPCEKCCGTTQTSGYFFISNSGEKYHTSRECSGLTRRVRLVPKKDVPHLSLCSRCG